MFKDNKDFYPTPENIIKKMLEGLDFTMIQDILEPSAGNGNIVEVLKRKEESISSYYKKHNFNIDCIEADQNLRHILKGKNFRVVHDDFLTYETRKEYDLIIMNPPFSNGCKHLLKALKMQEKNGGCVICLLNAETLKNPYTNERMDLQRKLTEYNADIEFIENTFTDAERKTNVEVALIKVQLPEVKRESFIFEELRKVQEYKEIEETENTQLIDGDFFKAIVTQYNIEVEAGIKLIKEYYAMRPLILASFGKDEETGETVQKGGCILSMDLSRNIGKYNNILSINGYIKEVRRKYWTALFNNSKFIGKLTNKLQEDFYRKIDELVEYDFSLYNIYQLKIDMNGKVITGIEEAIISLFDELSYKYHWFDGTSSNIHYYNGWKTNQGWKINKKVILPLKSYSWGRFDPTDYYTLRKLQDIEKCLNYLDGGLTDAVDMRETLLQAQHTEQTKNIVLKYFTVTFYKKGTCHIVFNNDELLKKFNIFGGQHKRWLPPSYGKKQYKDMTSEEKAVVNAFEGEKEYNKVFTNKGYYLFNGNNLNLLEDGT